MRFKNLQKRKAEAKNRRQVRVRAKIFGTEEKPRLSVFRSATHISAQIINDLTGKTLVSANDFGIQKNKDGGKVGIATEVGKILAERARAKNILKVVFDRSGYTYHGRIKALADGAREGGLEF